MHCLVTGATGYIGTALCEALRHRGDTLSAYSRSGATLPDGTPTTALDLQDHRLGLADLRGVDVVFHLAGIAHQQAPASLYEEVNTQATLALADACLCAGVNHLVFLSSVKAMGRAGSDAPRTESDCSTPTDPYGRSKLAAEEGLREACRDRLALTIIRPSLVYSDGAKGNLALLEQWVQRRLPRPPAGGSRSMIARDDLVELLCRLSERSGVDTRTWIATDGRGYSTRDIYDLLRAAHGLGPGHAWCPRWLWRSGAAVLDLLRPGVESHWDKLFAAELYSNDALLRDTDWRPRLSLSDVLLPAAEAP